MEFDRKVSFYNPIALAYSGEKPPKVMLETNGDFQSPASFPRQGKHESDKDWNKRYEKWEREEKLWIDGIIKVADHLLNANWMDYAILNYDARLFELSIAVFKYLDGGKRIGCKTILFWEDVFRNLDKAIFECDMLKAQLIAISEIRGSNFDVDEEGNVMLWTADDFAAFFDYMWVCGIKTKEDDERFTGRLLPAEWQDIKGNDNE